MNRAAIFVILIGAVAPTVPAKAETVLEGFRMPSNNIHCQFAYDPDPKEALRELRCDIRNLPRPLKALTRHCPSVVGSGDSVTLSMDAKRAEPTCHGDTTYNEENPVLSYGSTWTRMGITCTSSMKGLECRNKFGNGFFLSRNLQKLF
jgi:hypothetical protein